MESGTRCSSCNGSGVAGDQPADAPLAFACFICKEVATNAVVTFCGHLFCWPCLHRWQRGQQKPCPVCSYELGPSEVIPVYGSSAEGSSEDRSIPPRPPPRSLVPRSNRSSETSSEDVGAADAGPIGDPGTDGFDFQAHWDRQHAGYTEFSFSLLETSSDDEGTAAAADPIGVHANHTEFSFFLYDL